MIITSIQQQIKNAGRYSLYVDGEYAFSLSVDALLEAGVMKGQDLSQQELTAYKKLSQDDKVYSLALAYVARRIRSEGELRDYFRRKKYEHELSESLLKRLRQAGLVDDHEFARRWVENRRLLKGASTRRLVMELRQKHVSQEVIDAALDEDETDELQLLRDIVAKKRKQNRYQDDQKLIAYLARQGFSYEDSKKALQMSDD
ncbi:RecX family transcriptional regulator [Candidatus Saccharibacteria bacterium]|nr:RecX family transcriptional regulator [Candidatus Saccharibacteria bacterium]